MIIRAAKEDDALAINVLVSSLANYFCEQDSKRLPEWFSETITPSAISTRINDDAYLNYVYLHGEDIVGYIAIVNRNHLCHLFVNSARQGKGIARQLWDYACQQSGSDHYSVRSSLYAVPVYERFGFKVCGPVGIKDGIAFQPMEVFID